MLYLLAGIIIGALVGWYAREMRNHLSTIADRLKNPEPPKPKPVDTSGVVSRHTVYERGKIVDIPKYEPGKGAIVRPRSPQQVKKDGDAHIEQVINELTAR